MPHWLCWTDTSHEEALAYIQTPTAQAGAGHTPESGTGCRRAHSRVSSMKSLYHPALGQSVNYTIQEVPEGGDAQTAAVVGIMSRYAMEDSSSPEIKRDADIAVSECAGCTPAESVFWFVKKRLRFVRDEETVVPFEVDKDTRGGVMVEALIRPRDMSTMAHEKLGDCDDFSMYTASLLLALGVPASFVTVAASPDQANTEFSHVYVAAYPGGVRVPLDTSHGDRPGWETAKARRIKEWEIGGVGSYLPLVVILVIGAWMSCR